MGRHIKMGEIRTIPPVLTRTEWNALLDHSLIKGASFIVYSGSGLYWALNGSTGKIDYSGSNASTVISGSLSALTSGRTWKEKITLKGDFSFTDELLLPSYTILDLTQAKLTLANATNKHLLRNSDSANGNTAIDLIGGILNGNGANQSVANGLIEFYKSTAIRLIDMIVYDGYFHNITFTNQCSKCSVVNVESYGAGVTGLSGDGLTIAGSTDSGTEPHDIQVLGGFYHNCTSYGIGIVRVDATYVIPYNITLLGAHCYSNTSYGIEERGRWNKIIGCHAYNNGKHGINMGNPPDIVVTYDEVIGNTLYNNASVTAGYSGLYAHSNYSQFKDNIAFDTRPGVDRTQAYGMYINYDQYNEIIGNIGNNNLTAEFFIPAIVTNIVKNNLGYKTENFGTSNITTTSGSIVHGLAVTPTIVNITASGSASTMYMGSFGWYPSGSAGIWVIQTGSGTVGFNWKAEV